MTDATAILFGDFKNHGSAEVLPEFEFFFRRISGGDEGDAAGSRRLYVANTVAARAWCEKNCDGRVAWSEALIAVYRLVPTGLRKVYTEVFGVQRDEIQGGDLNLRSWVFKRMSKVVPEPSAEDFVPYSVFTPSAHALNTLVERESRRSGRE